MTNRDEPYDWKKDWPEETDYKKQWDHEDRVENWITWLTLACMALLVVVAAVIWMTQ